MEITFVEDRRSLIVKISGEIDHHSSTYIKEQIDRAFSRSGAKNIIFDFSEVQFMDSSGIGILIGRYRELAKQGGKVCAINMSNEIGRIFNISGLKKIINCCGSLDEAINAGVVGGTSI